MLKWLVLSIGGHNYDPGAQTEALKSTHLIFGDHGLRNVR